MDTPTQSSQAASALLADGIRYERGGVVDRAREHFEATTRHVATNPAAAAEAWWRLANLHRLHASWDDALSAAQRSVALARQHGLVATEADALNIEGAVWTNRGDFEKAREILTRMLALAPTHVTRAKALQNLGGLSADEGKFDEAERLFSESREAYRLAGDQRGEAISLVNIGRLQMERGFPVEARETLETAAIGARQSGDVETHAVALLNLGMALSALGLSVEAEDRITVAYGQFTIADLPMRRVQCLIQLAKLATERSEFNAARICLTHARVVAGSAGIVRELQTIDEQLAALPIPI